MARYEMETNGFAGAVLWLYDLKGVEQMVQSLSSPSGSVEIDLPVGHYFYVIRTKDEELLATGKLIKIQ